MLNISLKLYTVSFPYLHNFNQAVDLNQISLCIFLSLTQVYIFFAGRTLFKTLSTHTNDSVSPLNSIVFDIRVSFPFFSLAAARTICLLKEIDFVLAYVQFPFSQKLLFLTILLLNMLSVTSLVLNSYRICRAKHQIYP